MTASGITENLYIVGRKLADDKFRMFDSFTQASGALADAEERSLNDPSREYIVLSIDVTETPEELFFSLPLQGDFKGTNTFSLYNIVAEEMDKDQFIMWNVSSPSGSIDSLTFRASYTVEASENGDIDFDIDITEMPSGVDLSNPVVTTTSFNLPKPPGGWIQDRLYCDEFPVTLSTPTTDFNIKLTRTTETFPKKVRIITLAVRYGQ